MFFALGQSVSEIIEVVTNLVGFFEDLAQMVEVILSNPGFVTQLPALFVGSIASNQRVQNPFAPTDDVDNATFATGWYAGYVAGFIVEAIVGSKGSTKLVDSLGEFSSTIGRLQDAYGGLRAAISGATVSPAKQFALQFGRELRDVGFSTRAGKAVLEGVSVAKQFPLKLRLRVRLGSEVVDGLSNQEQRFLGRLARRPDVDASTLRRLDEDGALDDVLTLRRCRVSASVATSGAAVLGTAITCPTVPQDDLATAASRLSNAIDDGAIDTDDAATIRRAVLDNDDVDGGVVVRTLRDGDDEAAQFLAAADDEALGALTGELDDAATELRFRVFAQRTGRDGAEFLDRQGAARTRTLLDEDVSFRGADRNGGESVVDGGVVGDDGTSFGVSGRFFDDGEQYVADLLDENEDTLEGILEEVDSEFHQRYLDAKADPDTDAHQWLFDNIGESSQPSTIRGAIGEEIIQPDVLRRADADFDLSDGSVYEEFQRTFDADTQDTGFDGLAETEDGDLVIIETKVQNENGRVVTTDWFEQRANGEFPVDFQFSDAWTRRKFAQMAEEAEAGSPQQAFLDRLESENYISIVETPEGIDVELNANKINRRFVAIQDGDVTGELASTGLRPSQSTLNIDRVDVVKIGDVFAIGSSASSIADIRRGSTSPTITSSVRTASSSPTIVEGKLALSRPIYERASAD